MISVIICSVNKILLSNITKNIKDSIGVPFEILSVDNSNNQRGLAKVYNDLGKKAKYDIICFIHEDVIMHTQDWGNVLIKLFKDKNIGLVGISGAIYKSKYPGTWSACDSTFYRTHSIQHFKNCDEPVITNNNPDNVTHTEVAVIDGVFLATSKLVFNQFIFDEKILKGFHCYDIDYSLQVGKKYKIIVSYEILLEHLSAGVLTKEWLQDSIIIHKKWSYRLKIICSYFNKQEVQLNDYLAIKIVLLVALGLKSNNYFVLLNYFRLIFKFRKFNSFEFSKTVLRYLFCMPKKATLL